MKRHSSIPAILGAVLGVMLGTLALTSAAALAAAPEAPETLKPEAVGASGALLRGILNPGKEGAPGTFEIDTYEFLYKASATECKGGAKSPAGMSLGGGMEPVAQEITGLQPHARYAVCLAASNGTQAIGTPVTFITGPLEAPEDSVSEVTATTAKLSGALNPQNEAEPSRYDFFYFTSASECINSGFAYNAGEGISSGAEHEAQSVVVTGLSPDVTYTYCLVAQHEGEEARGLPVTFTTPVAAPTIGYEDVTSVGTGEAIVGAGIDPDGLATSYRVEYGATAAYGASTPAVSIGAGDAAASALVHLSGLQPSMSYHFRFVAENEHGAVTGEDETLVTTASSGGSTGALPDNRAYELVSSPTENVTVYSLSGGPHGVNSDPGDESGNQPDRAAAEGNAIAYSGAPAREEGDGAFSDGQSNEWVATRAPNGWTDSDVTPSGGNTDDEYSVFSESLSVGVLLADNSVSIAASPMAPAGCRQEIFSRSSDGALHSLIAQPPNAGECGYSSSADVSANGDHVIFEDEVALTPGAASSGAFERHNVYDSVGGSLHQVNVLPDGQPESSPDAWLGAPPEGTGNDDSPNYSNAISADGSRVFWTSIVQEGATLVPRDLYLRENDTAPQSPIGPDGECTTAGDACTVQVDVGEAACVKAGQCKSGGGLFWTASADGSKVLFTDENKLTPNSTAGAGEPDLYEYEVATGTLTDLTVAHTGHADVQGVIGASEDAEYVYFAANGVLASDASGDGETAQTGREEGKTDIYLVHDGVTTFIAAGGVRFPELDPEYFSDWARGLGARTAEVNPDGQAMVFESTAPVTGYDNHGVNSEGGGMEAPEVFVYDAATNRISCASCDPTGAPPNVPIAAESSLLPLAGSGEVLAKEFLLRWLSASGSRVFFDSEQALVPQDTNGVIDVYEWERPASGSEPSNSCSLTSPSYSKVDEGCVFLLSGGQSPDASYLADADAEGDNVFFTSRGTLTPEVGDENVAMYDARVDGGFRELSTSCVGTGCQGVPPAPPIFATPASATYNGVGNFESAPTVVHKTSASKRSKCRKGSVRKGEKCVKRKSKKQAKRPGKHVKRRKK
jgi:hypothetical protein